MRDDIRAHVIFDQFLTAITRLECSSTSELRLLIQVIRRSDAYSHDGWGDAQIDRASADLWRAITAYADAIATSDEEAAR